MGCDIHAYLEKKNVNGKYEYVQDVFDDGRDYNLFACIADVRNYSNIEPIIPPRRGMPSDVSAYVRDERNIWGSDGHSVSWIDIDEFFNFDYSKNIKQNASYNTWGGVTNGNQLPMTYQDFLGEHNMKTILRFGKLIDHRIVFWFDN